MYTPKVFMVKRETERKKPKCSISENIEIGENCTQHNL